MTDEEKGDFFRGGRCWREERKERKPSFFEESLNEISSSADVPSSKLLFQYN